ncbi:AI-2E family transporter [Propionivibrio limicola]|uniref:AI-2E family transporter n=1 Tax=Propionivibrio limicola TaxID=167645 RepID=UPI001292ADFB|nr:AI-2E family transporter [Propionivibrio limicola]
MTNPGQPTFHDYTSWILAALGILFVLHFRLLPALIAGLLVYELVHALYPLFSWRLPTCRAKGVAVVVVVLIVVALVSAAGFGVFAFIKREGSLPTLLAKMAEILEDSRAHLPAWLGSLLPNSAQGISEGASRWLREHANDLQQFGKETAHSLAHVLIGMVIGAMVSLHEVLDRDARGPLARALVERLFRLGEAFRRIVFAQVRISAVNTTLTALYLAVALPLFGVSLPLTKTMIVVTFIAGLLPVIGNLISNTVIFVVSLAHSTLVAFSSLGFLIVIHKLEYFLNARIVGGQINAKAWELLTAMLIMESAFGVSGLIAAPICYAWLKDELGKRCLI